MIVKTPYKDIKMHVRAKSPSDLLVIKEILEENVYHLHDNMIIDSGVVLDVGANIGAFTIDILRRAKNNGKPVTIYAIEPEPHNLKLLEKNLELNKHLMEDSQVHIIRGAIGDHIDFVNISNEHGGSRIADKGARVLMTTLDSLLVEIDAVDFMKADIEGSEIPMILAASDETIDKIKRTAIEFDEQNGLDKFAQVVNRFGRKCSISTLGVPARGCYLYAERHI